MSAGTGWLVEPPPDPDSTDSIGIGTGPPAARSPPPPAPPAAPPGSWSSGCGVGPLAPRPLASAPTAPPDSLEPPVEIVIVTSGFIRAVSASDEVGGDDQSSGVDLDVDEPAIRARRVEQHVEIRDAVGRAILDPLPAERVDVGPRPLAAAPSERGYDLLVVIPGHRDLLSPAALRASPSLSDEVHRVEQPAVRFDVDQAAVRGGLAQAQEHVRHAIGRATVDAAPAEG